MNETDNPKATTDDSRSADFALLACPFCGGEGQGIDIRTSDHWTGTRSVVISATVIHWCNREEGQPQTCVQVKGKTVADAVAKWNRRAG